MTADEHRDALDVLAKTTCRFPADRFFGRGIVICAGGDYLPGAYVTLKLLRHLDCALPVEIWHLGANEVPEWWRIAFEPLCVSFVDATEVSRVHPCRVLKGWELKAYSILHSKFSEILLLDADNVAVMDPTYLFECPEYLETGALFWPDRGRLKADHPIWSITRVPFHDEPELESGQMVIDKARCWKALQLTMHFNEHSDFYYNIIHGDKETFHFGFRRARKVYAVAPPVEDRDWLSMYQHDFEGRRIFQHRNGAKWSLDTNASVPGFLHEDRCIRDLEELKLTLAELQLKTVTPKARPLHDEIIAQRVYLYVRIGLDYRTLEFLPLGRIGHGRRPLELSWSVSSKDRVLVLSVLGVDGELGQFTRGDNGTFTGKWIIHEKCDCLLIPMSA